MLLLKKRYAEKRKDLQQYCRNLAWMEKWWADSMECYCNLRNALDLLADGKTPYERRFEEPLKGPIIPFGAVVEYHPISTWDLSRLHQFGKKVLPGIFLGSELIAEGFSKGDILIADLEDLEKLDASEIHLRRFQRERNTKRKWIHIPGTRWYSKIVRKRLRIPRTHSKTETNRKESQPAETIDDAEAPCRPGLHPQSSPWTSSSTLCAERRNIHHFPE